MGIGQNNLAFSLIKANKLGDQADNAEPPSQIPTTTPLYLPLPAPLSPDRETQGGTEQAAAYPATGTQVLWGPRGTGGQSGAPATTRGL